MRFIGIDVAAESHVLAIVDETGTVLQAPVTFAEDAAGYAQLRALLGPPTDTLVALEATGHYWRNLVTVLLAEGVPVALLNPLRTRRFAEADLRRAKTDAIDALGIARFAAEKRPAPTRVPDTATQELRELVRFRQRLVQDLGDRVRQLHRLVDLGFPEFPRHVPALDSALALALLRRYPTAAAYRGVRAPALAHVSSGKRLVGRALAATLLRAAATSVGQHHGPVYQLEVRCVCEDIELLQRRLRQLGTDIERLLRTHEVGRLLTTITGIGPQTAARVVAEVGDPAEFRDAAALAAYIGAVPATHHSGKRRPVHAALTPIGHARLRSALWMPTLTAVRHNPWLRRFYLGLRARGKLPKVALIAAMRKLIAAIYSVAKNRRPFVPHLLPPGVPA